MNEKFIKCSCTSEYVRLFYDEEMQTVDLSVWSFQNSHGPTWADKLRWIWRIVTKGSPYGDQVILEKEQVKEIIDYLQNKELY